MTTRLSEGHAKDLPLFLSKLRTASVVLMSFGAGCVGFKSTDSYTGRLDGGWWMVER